MNKLFKDLFPDLEINFYTLSEYNLYTFRVYYDSIPDIDLKIIVTGSNDENSHIKVALNKTEDLQSREKVDALKYMQKEIEKRNKTELFSEIKEALIEDDIKFTSNFNIQIVIG